MEMYLEQGQMGYTKLRHGYAVASLDSHQRLSLDCYLEPHSYSRQAGYVIMSGSMPVTLSELPAIQVSYALTSIATEGLAQMISIQCLVANTC